METINEFKMISGSKKKGDAKLKNDLFWDHVASISVTMMYSPNIDPPQEIVNWNLMN